MAKIEKDNLVNEFNKICHCCKRHIYFERNTPVENIVFFEGLFYHEECFKELSGFYRKCVGCHKNIAIQDSEQPDILLFKDKYWHVDCFKEHNQNKPILIKYIPEYKKDASSKIFQTFNGRKKNLNKLNEYKEAAVKEVSRVFDEKLVNDYIRKQYDIQAVPWESIAALYDGKYGTKVPAKHLYDMFVRKQPYLNKIYAQNVIKGKEMDAVSRVKYDLKVLYNKYDSYLKFLEKQKLLESESTEVILDGSDFYLPTVVSKNKEVEMDCSSDSNENLDGLLNDIFGESETNGE